MTEAEWLTSANPWNMIAFVSSGASDRKLRLFACACCRQVLNPFVPAFIGRAVAVAEAFADGEISADALASVREVVAEAVGPANREDATNGTGYLSHVLGSCLSVCHPGDVMELAQDTSHATASAAADLPRRGGTDRESVQANRPTELSEELAAQADLLRDISGNPFRSSEIQLEWLTDTVLAIARGIYTDRAFDRMPILADALQDAGCDDADILSHCREAREHVRGCWVVDLLLGKR